MSGLKVNDVYIGQDTGVHAAVTLPCQYTLNKYHLCKIDDSS